MDSSKIEVGDVFTHPWTFAAENVVDAVDGDGNLYTKHYGPIPPQDCTLVRKADPYHGLTLPAPPAGYRLAKWGEELSMGALWWSSMTRTWGDEGGDTETRWMLESPHMSIFAIPLDQPESVENLVATMQDRGYTVEKVQPPIKSWQFREVPWVMPEPKTLADCVECAPVVVESNFELIVRVRHGNETRKWDPVANRPVGNLHVSPNAYKFVRYLDPPQQKPISLDDAPDGRVVRCQDRWHWKVGATWWRLSDSGGVWPNMVPRFGSEFTITNYIAEFRGPA